MENTDVAKSLNNVLRVEQRIHLGGGGGGGGGSLGSASGSSSEKLFNIKQEESEILSMRKVSVCFLKCCF